MKWLLVVLAFLACAPAWSDPSPSKVVRLIVILPNGYRSTGTGFVVEAPSGNYYTLTNQHVCAPSWDGTLIAESEFQQRSFVGVPIIKVGTNVDLCVLAPVPFVPPTPLGVDPKAGQIVFLIGHPNGGPVSIRKGTVLETAFGVIESSAKAFPGNSGSPLLSLDMGVVGVVSATHPGTFSSVSIPVHVIKEFLKGL